MKQPWGLKLLSTPRIGRAEGTEEPLERKAAALLAYLALQGPSSRSTLAGLLWPDTVESRARNNLRQLLHRLRSYPDLLVSEGELRLGEVAVDAAELDALAAEGASAQVAERWGRHPPALLEGLDYDDCPDLDAWVLAERERLLGLVRDALASETERCEAMGALGPALEYAQQLSALDPLSEAAYRRLMRLHYLAGDRGQALAAFRRCQQVLRETFDLEPLPDTVELARAIDSGAAPRPAPRASRELPVTLIRPPSLVGREEAWAQLEDAWGRVRTIFVTGEAGIGKTRLLRDFARSKGSFVLTRGMPGDRHVPYASKARSLGALLRQHPGVADAPWVRNELARLLPDLFDAPAAQAPITDEPQKLRLFEAAALVMERALEGAATLINDDIHLWDDASYEMGAYFASRFADSHAHALVGLRIDEAPRERLLSLRSFVDAGLAAVVELEPLTRDAVATIIDDAGLDAEMPDAAAVQRLAGGNPFYVLEALRNVWQEGPTDEPLASASLPARAPTVLTSRIARLSGTAADLLRVRALAATAFSPELAAAVLETGTAQVREGLDELERHRLLDHGELGHELIADAIERHTPEEALRLWHRRLAAQLAGTAAPPGVVAVHFLEGFDAAAAFPHLCAAAAAARQVFALDEARRWYHRALWAAPGDRERAEALLGLDDVAVQQGRRDDSGAVLDELEPLAQRLQDATLLMETALHRARWHMLRGDRDRAEALAAEALADAERSDDTERVDRARLTLGDVAYLAGDYAAAHRHFHRVTQSDDDARRLRAFQRLGALEGLRGEVDAAFEHHRQALLLARRAGDLPLVATLLNSLGADRERRGAYLEALRHFEEAEAVAARAADRRTGAIALANASLVAVSRGTLAQALGYAGRALEVAAPLGNDRALAMAWFAQGYTQRRLGRADDARRALAQAIELRRAGGDVRGSLVAEFNLAAMALERDRSDPAALTTALELLDRVEALDIPQFCAWCHLELAVLHPEPGAGEGHVARALALDDGEHLCYAAAAAALAVALGSGNADAIERTRLRLLEPPPAAAVGETSYALRLLADSADDPARREAGLLEARERVATEVEGLGDGAAELRWAYLEQRLPTSG